MALLLADYKELVLRYETLSRAIARQPAPAPAPSPPQPTPAARSPVFGMNSAAPAAQWQSHPQTAPLPTTAGASVITEGAAPERVVGSQFIQRAEEAAEPDLLGAALMSSGSQDTSAAATQHTAAQHPAAVPFDPFGSIADAAQNGATDRSSAGHAAPAPMDPFLVLERAASAMGPPSSGVQTEQDAESELAAFRAELPASEPDGTLQPVAAAPAADVSQPGPTAAHDEVEPPGGAGADASSAPLTVIASSAREPTTAGPGIR